MASDLRIKLQDLLSDPLSFVDRKGQYHAPARLAERLARLVVEEYPESVLKVVADELELLRERTIHGASFDHGSWSGHVPAEKYATELREREPVFALVREWCGAPAQQRFDEVVALRAEVVRLTRLVEQAAEHLDGAGRPRQAALLRGALGGQTRGST